MTVLPPFLLPEEKKKVKKNLQQNFISLFFKHLQF